jgi:hypothetical protein
MLIENGDMLSLHKQGTDQPVVVNCTFNDGWTVDSWFKTPLSEQSSQPGRYHKLLDQHAIVLPDGTLGSHSVAGFQPTTLNVRVLSNGWHRLIMSASTNNVTYFVDGELVGVLAAVATAQTFSAVGNIVPSLSQAGGYLHQFRVYSATYVPKDLEHAAGNIAVTSTLIILIDASCAKPYAPPDCSVGCAAAGNSSALQHKGSTYKSTGSDDLPCIPHSVTACPGEFVSINRSIAYV